MTKFITPLFSVLAFIFICSCKKKVFPEDEKYTISIDSIRRSASVSDYDTIWFTVSPQDGKKTIISVNGSTNTYLHANPEIINATEHYLVLNRNFPNYNNGSQIRLTVLAYGFQQGYIDTPYLTTTTTTSNNIKLSGKILFQTNSNWVLWDLGTQKVISTASFNLEVVDYNSTLGKILVKSGSYLYYYNEDFSTYSSYYISDYNYSSNYCFDGPSTSISYFSTYDRYGHKFTPSSTFSPILPDNHSNYLFSFNTSQNTNAYVTYYHNYYYELRFSNNNNMYQTISSSNYNNYDNIEVSSNGSYILYTYDYALKIYDVNKNSTITPYISTYNKACFDNTSSKVSFVKSNQLGIYDITSGDIIYPFSNSSYNSIIYQAYW
jgi:hypothetical protein